MAGETSSTNMGMPIPGVGSTAGPTWASDLNASLTIVDAHDHSVGSGVAITPSGMNINADLPFGTHSATGLLKASFTSQSAALTGTSFLSFVGGNLYVNDSSGNQIPITSGGGVAGSPGSIGSLAAPASATYSAGSKLFSWKSDSTKAAAMDNGAVTIRETNVASAKGITLTSPSSLAADYALTLLTALPGSTQVINCDSSGNLGTITYDNIGATMTPTGANALAATMTSTGTSSIVATATAANANTLAAKVTRATGTTVAAGGVAISASSGIFNTTSAAYVDVTNLSVTITTSGRPVKLSIISDGTGLRAFISSPSNSANCSFSYKRDSTTISDTSFIPVGGYIPPLEQIDAVAAGTYNYKVQIKSDGSNTLGVASLKLVAYEL